MLKQLYLKSAYCVFLSLSAGLAQTLSDVTPLSPLLKAVPIDLRHVVSAVGDRFLVAGKERMVMRGTLSLGSAAPKSVVVISEIPRRFSYQEDSGSSVVTNGVATTANLSVDYLAVLQSLFEDALDGMLYQVATAARFRPLMHRARTDDGKAKIYNGPYVDIYDLVLSEPSLGRTSQQKHFYFDSTTHLLSQVVYITGAPQSLIKVATTFTNWQLVNGIQVPGTIARTENGAHKLTFTTTQTTFGAALGSNTFVIH